MSHSRKDSDAPPLRGDESELKNLVVTVHTHTRLASQRFYNFWHYTDSSAKCNMAKRFIRTKQILIILTSCLFIFGTIWFGSHPDVRPVLVQQQEKHVIRPMPTASFRPVPDNTDLLRRFGLLDEEDDPMRVPFDETSMQELAYPRSGWDIYLPEWANLTSPLIVTAMFEIKDFENMIKLIWSVKEYGGDSHLAIFDMTEVKNEHKAKNQQDDFRNMYSLETYCNLTEICSVQSVKFREQKIPKYIRKKDFGAYKPIIIQRMLKLFPLVLWIDSDMILSSSEALQSVWRLTSRHNVTTFRILNGCSVSSYTFKKMLPYFGLVDRMDAVNYAHMIESGVYAFRRTKSVDRLIRLWLNCSLTETCIKPIGVSNECSSTSCKDNQPTFAYLNCHKFETSALCASLVSLSFHRHEASHEDYEELVMNTQPDKETGFNMTAIKISISTERHRILKLYNRVKVNLLEQDDEEVIEREIRPQSIGDMQG